MKVMNTKLESRQGWGLKCRHEMRANPNMKFTKKAVSLDACPIPWGRDVHNTSVKEALAILKRL